MKAIYFALALGASVLFCADVQVVGIQRTPEPENASLSIVLPEDGDVEESPVYLQFRLRGFPLGVYSDFPRGDDIYNYSLGQNLRIIIDDEPFFARVEQRIDPFQDQGNYYEAMYKVKMPFSLKDGRHTIRAFLARSFGESLKSPEAFAAGFFYFGSKGSGFNLDLENPYLIYNEPDSSHSYSTKEPILLDFLVKNKELSKDGYKVKLTIDGKIVKYLTFPPYYIYNLSRGEHIIELMLVDRNDKKVSGSFNQVKRVIRVF